MNLEKECEKRGITPDMMSKYEKVVMNMNGQCTNEMLADEIFNREFKSV